MFYNFNKPVFLTKKFNLQDFVIIEEKNQCSIPLTKL